MSQGIERWNKGGWRSPSAWVRSAGSTLAESSRTPGEETDCVATVSEWLRAAPRRLASLDGEQLVDAVARIEDAYDEFPELEIDVPRRALVDELRALLDRASGLAALPPLMACAALDPAPAAELVAALLDGMARGGRGEASARAAAILARRRAVTGDEIAPAVAELCRQGCLPAALALTVQASGDGDPMAASVALGAELQHRLFAGDDAARDRSELARTILSARRRVQRAIQPHAKSGPGLRKPTPRLLELADRVAAKLPRRPVSPPIAATPAPWRTGRLGFAEFAAQWPEICDVAIEWLSAMRVGRAGERRDAGVWSRPGEAGHLVYGPYVKLGAGDYRVRVHWRAGRPTRHVPRGQPVATIEVVSRYGKTYLAQHQLRAEDCLSPRHEVMFHIIGRPPPAFPVEVRVWTNGAVPLTVSSITVERITAPARLVSAGVKRGDMPGPE